MGVPGFPDVLELGFRTFLHLEAIHRDKHQIGSFALAFAGLLILRTAEARPCADYFMIAATSR
jgi:hypothetical protein